ncbi:MAG TPA: AMP-binding protein, partial [Candidatus Obscuribacter sp.]|nr:AMP-binding protein [Candidatus Obscuribacter sp.]
MPTENETGVGAPGPGELPFRSPLFGLLQESLAGGHKDREFLYFEGKSYSFAQVHELALRLASLLAREGVARGERVAVYLYNSPE